MKLARTQIIGIFIAVCFISTAAANSLNCNFYTSGWGNAEGLYYTCKVIDLRTESPNILIDRILGNHIENFSNDDVKHWVVENSPRMLFMPRGVGDFFKNLEEVYIRNVGLQSITQSDLRQFQSLEQLTLYETELRSLESGLFQFNPRLKLLNLNSNRLSSIAPDVLSPLKNLFHVSLKNNVCIDIDMYKEDGVKKVIQEIIKRCQSGAASSAEMDGAAIIFPKIK